MTEPTTADEQQSPPDPRPITPIIDVHQQPEGNLVELVMQSSWAGFPLTLYMPWGIASGHIARPAEYYQHLADRVSDKSSLPDDADPEWHNIIDTLAQEKFGQWVDMKPSERVDRLFYDGVNLTAAVTLKDPLCWIGGFPNPIRHEFLRVRLTDVTAWSWGRLTNV